MAASSAAFGQVTTIVNVDVNATANRIVDAPVGDPFFKTNFYTFTVSGLGTTVTDVDFRLSLLHSFVGDLDVYLISPTGVQMAFTNVAVLSQGGSGNNFQDTYFDEQGGLGRIGTTGFDTAPFLGPEYAGGFRYKTQNAPGPNNPMNDDTLDRFNGIDPNGTWTLRIVDGFNGDDGFLLRAGDNPRVIDDTMQAPSGDTWGPIGTLAIGTQLIITVPEPQTLGLVTLGLAGVLLLASRSRRD